MVGKRSMLPEEIRVGMTIWISHEVSTILSQAFSDVIKDNITVPGGIWTVKNTDILTDDMLRHHRASNPIPINLVAAIITITRADWQNPHKIKDLDIIINVNGHIILAGNILVEDAFRPYFETTQDLIELNKHRKDCASCGRPLYIPMNNIHICKECEADLDDQLPF